MEKKQEIIASNTIIDFNRRINEFLGKLRHKKIIDIKYILKDSIDYQYYAFIIYQT